MSVSNSPPLLPARQSSFDSIPSCNVYFATSAENHCNHHACDGSRGGGGGVWWICDRSRETVTHWKRLSGNATGWRLQRFFKEEFKSRTTALCTIALWRINQQW